MDTDRVIKVNTTNNGRNVKHKQTQSYLNKISIYIEFLKNMSGAHFGFNHFNNHNNQLLCPTEFNILIKEVGISLLSLHSFW